MTVQYESMQISPIQTDPIHANEYTLSDFLDAWIHNLSERDVVVITSKVVSLCEGAVVAAGSVDKNELIESESDFYLPSDANAYGFHISIKNNTLIASAGIDESNGDGHYVLWPRDPQASANAIREALCKTFGLQSLGVIITDSHVLPLRWGTVGTAIAHSGFAALNSYIGKPDIFGRNLKVTNSNVAEGLAAAAVVVMGEGDEQTPIAVISDVPFVQFEDHMPTSEDLAKLAISKEEDIFAPLLNAVEWKSKK